MEGCAGLAQNRNVEWYEVSDRRIMVAFRDGSTYIHAGRVGRSQFEELQRAAAVAETARDILEGKQAAPVSREVG